MYDLVLDRFDGSSSKLREVVGSIFFVQQRVVLIQQDVYFLLLFFNERILSFATDLVSHPTRAMSALPNYNFETLLVTSPKEFVYEVKINRPEQLNSMNKAFW